jgi:hypothetical protein
MNERQRRAITWDTIERIAFQPANATSWLRKYGVSLDRFWKTQNGDVQHTAKGFEAWFLNIACEYEVLSRDQYSVSIINAASDRKLSWSLHVRPAYCSKASLVGAQDDYPTQHVADDLRGDVTAVLNGMLFHPRNHCHGEDMELTMTLAATALPPHEVRVGGGIGNAFVFLTHLRYQLCLLNGALRDAERDRLIDLFTTAIRDKRNTVPAKEILNLTR